jgi:hypothetical protein
MLSFLFVLGLIPVLIPVLIMVPQLLALSIPISA